MDKTAADLLAKETKLVGTMELALKRNRVVEMRNTRLVLLKKCYQRPSANG